MHRFKLVGLMLIAVFAITAVASASASAAEPNVLLLSGGKFPVKFEGTSGKGVLATKGGLANVECEKDKNSGSVSSAKAGTLKLTFEGCKAAGIACETSGAGSGVIISEGTTLLVYDSLEPLLAAFLLTLSPNTTFKCGSLVSAEVKGTTLVLFGKVLKPAAEKIVSGTDFEEVELVVKHGKEAFEPEDKKYWESSTGTEKHPQLLSSLNKGEFKEAADESKENKAKFSEMIAIEF